MALYELLLRGNSDGTISGAHSIEFVPDGTSSDGSPRFKIGDAKPIDPATISTYVGAQFAGLAAQVVALTTERDALKAKLDAIPNQQPPTPSGPAPISDRQFAQELRNRGIITQDEALAFVGNGTVPAALAAVIAALPSEMHDDVMLSVVGAVTYYRDNPFTVAIGAAFGWTPEQIDEFFRAAVLL